MVEISGKPGVCDGIPDRQELRQPALPGALPLVRRMLAGFLGRLNVPATRSGDIQLAVTEACANVVRHAYPGGHGDLLCECEATDDEIVVRVSDWGKSGGRFPAQPKWRLGIPLIKRLSDHTTQRQTPDCTLVEMRFARSAGP